MEHSVDATVFDFACGAVSYTSQRHQPCCDYSYMALQPFSTGAWTLLLHLGTL